MRRALKLTKRERKQVERALKKLDSAYAAGKVNPLVYKDQRAKLLQNLQRPKSATTALEENQRGFFQRRRNMEFGPAPVGYWDATIKNKEATLQVNPNKVRQSLLSIHNNEWWNGGFQESLRESANARDPVNQANQQTQQEMSYYQQTVHHAQNLAGTVNANTFEGTDIWQNIENSEPVLRALERLAENVEYTVGRMMTVGMSEELARDAIRKAAITAGNAMTQQGYSQARAAEITAMVVKGELSINQAVSQVTSDINSANEAIAAMNSNTANPSNPIWRNNMDIHSIGPSGGGVSLSQLLNMKNDLVSDLELENDPAARNQIAEALNNLQAEINSRQAGIQSVSNALPGPRGQPTMNTQGNGYNPTQNYRANLSTMMNTIDAMSRGGPDLWQMVDDIVTIQGNMYFDYSAGSPTYITYAANNAPEYDEATSIYSPPNTGISVSTVITNEMDDSTIFPSGDFTVYSSGKASIPSLKLIISQIMNALNSPLIPDNERAYLMYLKYIMEFKIAHLESIEETVIPNNNGGNSTVPNNNGGNANNPYNLPNDAQNQAQNNSGNGGNGGNNANGALNNGGNNANGVLNNGGNNANGFNNGGNNANGVLNNGGNNANGFNNANGGNNGSNNANGFNNANGGNNGSNNANGGNSNQVNNPAPTMMSLVNYGIPQHIIEAVTKGHPRLSNLSKNELQKHMELITAILASGVDMDPRIKMLLMDLYNQLKKARDTPTMSASNKSVTNNVVQSGVIINQKPRVFNPSNLNKIKKLNTGPQAVVNTSAYSLANQLSTPVAKFTTTKGLGGFGGSTSTTTSSRSHGGARFSHGNDPRMAHRTW